MFQTFLGCYTVDRPVDEFNLFFLIAVIDSYNDTGEICKF